MRRTGDGHWMYECSQCRHSFRVRRSDSELVVREPAAPAVAAPPPAPPLAHADVVEVRAPVPQPVEPRRAAATPSPQRAVASDDILPTASPAPAEPPPQRELDAPASRTRVQLPDLDALVDLWHAHTAPIAVALLAIVAGILVASL